MVKCSNCGVEVADSFELCPNCGHDLTKNESKEISENTCVECGSEIKSGLTFCPTCGAKIEQNIKKTVCINCGAEFDDEIDFCSQCGADLSQKQKNTSTCPNCGVKIDSDTAFCQECGAKIRGFENKPSKVSQNTMSQSFIDRINLNVIIKPAILSLVIAVVLSLIGLLIGFSWFSFVIAIILSVGFFAGVIDNEANAIVFGLIVALILGILETPLVEFMYGAFVAGFYEGFFGSHLILFIVLGVVIAYISNMYLKDNIQPIVNNFKGLL